MNSIKRELNKRTKNIVGDSPGGSFRPRYKQNKYQLRDSRSFKNRISSMNYKNLLTCFTPKTKELPKITLGLDRETEVE